ncbi:hypothetical protein L484_007822 [Morus notabilis]|uniref:Uncharacterized protein n=1 Tax=Morus notabilis TaxID=981085 RepID=W9S737_9ROSA|nr:hypothetical protein L484_007822 [Morus notabilis]
MAEVICGDPCVFLPSWQKEEKRNRLNDVAGMRWKILDTPRLWGLRLVRSLGLKSVKEFGALQRQR